jgi:hypothetical protein
MKYNCNLCNKEFTRKANLDRHLDTTKCKSLNLTNNPTNTQPLYTPMYIYSPVPVYVENIKQNEFYRQLENTNKELEEKNKKLEEEIKKLGKKLKKTETQTKMVNINDNNTIINMVPYGQEDTSKDLDLILSIIWGESMNAIPELIKRIHFNKNHPEWHNIYVPCKKNTDLMVYTGKWETKTINEMVKKIYEDKKKFIIDNKDLFYNDLTPPEQGLYDNWVNKSMALETNISNEAQKYVNGIHRAIKNTLFDNKQLTLDTKKKVSQQNKNY